MLLKGSTHDTFPYRYQLNLRFKYSYRFLDVSLLVPDPRPKRSVQSGNLGSFFLNPFQLSDFLDFDSDNDLDDDDEIHEFLGFDDFYDTLGSDDEEED